MEEPHSVNSPRRTLSFSRKNGTGSFSFSDDRASEFGLSGEQGTKPSEVYGFLGAITTVVATEILMIRAVSRNSGSYFMRSCLNSAITVIILVWAYVPETWLHSVGIYYYPSRYWALVVPTYAMVTVILMLGFYIGLNFMSTPSPTSLNTLFDEFSREPSDFVHSMVRDEQPIEPISDIGIDKINKLMFKDAN